MQQSDHGGMVGCHYGWMRRTFEEIERNGETVMETKKTLAAIVAALEDLFQRFNYHYYHGELMQPVITVSP